MWRGLLIALLVLSAVGAANDAASDSAITDGLRRSQPYVRHGEIWRPREV
jgi:hypothetical protein